LTQEGPASWSLKEELQSRQDAGAPEDIRET
jgi:hypothetical protein